MNAKVKIVFDPLTCQFVADTTPFDEQSFKEEGRKYMMEKEKEEYVNKMAKAKENWDKRLESNEKVKEIVAELKQEMPNYQKVGKLAECKNKITELIIEEEETASEANTPINDRN
jgi:hypothetical protein